MGQIYENIGLLAFICTTKHETHTLVFILNVSEYSYESSQANMVFRRISVNERLNPLPALK